jgi:RimJ/RimL family protein N-acetyltransferase
MNIDSPDLPTQFTSESLLLRRYGPDDIPLYFQMLRDNADHLHEFLPAFLMDVRSEDDIKAWFDRQSAEWGAKTLFIFGAWEKATGMYVGESYLANPDWDVPRIEVGYFLVKEFTGKGYATEAANAAIGYAFEQLKVVRIDLRCAADNTASLHVAERCGFKQEGCFRQYHRKKDGALVDMLWYGLLLAEWQNGQHRLKHEAQSRAEFPGQLPTTASQEIAHKRDRDITLENLI